MRKTFSEFDNFLKKNNREKASGKLFSNEFDEPTYITVRINFFPDIISYNNEQNVGNYQYNSAATLSYDDMPHPLLDKTSAYSTINYLRNNLGDEHRANLLESFINGIIDLNYECPYYIKSVNGLNDLLHIDPKRGTRIVKDGTITLKCIEGLDMRITGLMNMYKKIVWDDIYQRWILPDMMRFFKMNIIISEFRLFNKNNQLDVANDINLKIPTIKYECQMCEFDITDTLTHFNQLNINNIKTPIEETEIKIKVGNVIEHDTYDLFTNSVDINDLILSRTKKIDISINKLENQKVLFNERFNKQYDLINNGVDTNKQNDFSINQTGYLEKLFNGTLDNIVNQGVNYLEDKAKNYLHTHKFLNGLTPNDYLNLTTSPNMLNIINEVKNRTEIINSLYPEISKATNDEFELNLYKNSLYDVANSIATGDDRKNILKILNNFDIKTLEEYSNKVTELFKNKNIESTPIINHKNKINKQIL